MKVLTKKKVVEERVPQYEPGDIVCVDDNCGIDHEWVIIIDVDGCIYRAIPFCKPRFESGEWNIWKVLAEDIDTTMGVVSVPLKGLSDLKFSRLDG